MSLTLQIREATADDLATCAECLGDISLIYRSIYPHRLRQSHITHEQRMQRNARQLAKELRDPHKAFFVAAESDASIAGYSIWQMPKSMLHSQAGHQASSTCRARAEEENRDPEVNYDLLAEISAESASVKDRFCGESTWFLHHLFVHASRQRVGVGAALISHGLDWINKQHRRIDAGSSPKIALTSTPAGVQLYRKYGFHDVYWFRPEWDDIDGEGKSIRRSVEWPLMLNFDAIQ